MTRTVTPIVALDIQSSDAALRVVDALGDLCSFYKIGSELFTAAGPDVVRAVAARGVRVFLDLKFHDIPNTVRGAARSAASLGANLITVHASGGQAMIAAAVQGASEASTECEVLAVTVLTSVDATGLSDVWGRRIRAVEPEVLRLARLAAAAAAHGVVCSGLEARQVAAEHGDDLAILVPGVRLAGGERQDQVRVVTPRAAADAGARYIVLGRTVTGAPVPQDAMRAVLADLP